jgi:hypothetical protein
MVYYKHTSQVCVGINNRARPFTGAAIPGPVDIIRHENEMVDIFYHVGNIKTL